MYSDDILFPDEWIKLDPATLSSISIDEYDSVRIYRSPSSGGPRKRMLYLHGLTFFTEVSAPMLYALAEEYDVLSLDLLGTGFTGFPKDGDYSLAGHIRFLLRVLSSPTIAWIPVDRYDAFVRSLSTVPDKDTNALFAAIMTLDHAQFGGSAAVPYEKFAVCGSSMGGMLAMVLTCALLPCVSSTHLVVPAGISIKANKMLFTKTMRKIISFLARIFAKTFANKFKKAGCKLMPAAQAAHAMSCLDTYVKRGVVKQYVQRLCAVMFGFPWFECGPFFKCLNDSDIPTFVYLAGNDEMIGIAETRAFLKKECPNIPCSVVEGATHDMPVFIPTYIVRLMESNMK